MSKIRTIVTSASLGAAAAVVATLAFAQPQVDKKAAKPEMKLPAGWSPEDMQACMLAGTPGKEHEELMKMAGTWRAVSKMWMGPGTEPMSTEGTWTFSNHMDGRFVKCDVDGEMPGMGPFKGSGLAGFDNVSRQYVGNWVDNHGTGIMSGVGERSGDGSTMTWRYTFNCPITHKPAVMREVMKNTSPTTMAVEMFCPDPKTGKEYKCMQVELTKAK